MNWQTIFVANEQNNSMLFAMSLIRAATNEWLIEECWITSNIEGKPEDPNINLQGNMPYEYL